ncbi:SDR family oxidoreductase [Actinoallomurus spadix]|uniref:SDR family oxidoreductase n=1 Tax=Actinoallomurus spadix TaxID=79912 RepID=A0ABP3FQV4_9ACTN|nr:SDR family oxidoreductase [Actinoallomurus spadix]MCO5985321.1 SDR family oxidoreductase [Actinoallomurus spadix]
MNIEGSVAVVTGGNRGFGRELVTRLVERGAKVYAAARRPETVDVPGAVPLRLDITDPASVRDAAAAATDATLLINNAGISTKASLLGGDVEDARREMETHYFGTLSTIRAFAPVIEANGGGTILNILSVLSWLHIPASGAYSAAKAAEWAMTDAVRQELRPKGILVAGLHVGYMETDMTAGITATKSDPGLIAEIALDGIAADSAEIIADSLSRNVKANLSAPIVA